MTNNIYCLTAKQWNIHLLKAVQYEKTTKVKNTASTKASEIIHHYGIRPGTPLSLKNILSILLYCDNTELCSKFSSTFRKSKPEESIQAVKRRNSEYAIWSKTLRETVEYFGQMGWRMDKTNKWNNENNRIRGPFYCGMSWLMIIPEFNIR